MSDGYDPDLYDESQYHTGGAPRRSSYYDTRYAHPQDSRDYGSSETPRTYDLSHDPSLSRQLSSFDAGVVARLLTSINQHRARNYQITPNQGRRNETNDPFGQRQPSGYEDDPRARRSHSTVRPAYAPAPTYSNPPQASWNETIYAQPAHPANAPSQVLLDERYFVQSPRYYSPGKVFSILWHENYGSRRHGTLVSDGPEYRGRFGEPIYSTIRRMVVIKVFDQCSWCFAISTYGSRGVSKPGVDKSKHAIVHLQGTMPAMKRSEAPMIKEPLEVAPERADETLDPMSRLNFGKIYTVEHNVKVLPIGRVTSASMTRFLQYASDELSIR
ncbi:hypothetical protein BDV12DRAFT_64569 [Aspergillus spectabilis]